MGSIIFICHAVYEMCGGFKIREDIMAEIYLRDNRFIDDMESIVVPKLSKVKEMGYYNTRDGKRLYYEKFISPEEKAVIVISHGFCEFAEKFEEVIYYFFCMGYSVYIPEHRGHGKSDRDVDDLSKVYVGKFDEYVTDFVGFVDEIVKKERADKKIVLYAHSMGGAIGALVLEQYPHLFNCAILTSPMLKMRYNGMPAIAAWFLKLYAKLFTVGKNYVPGQKAFDGQREADHGCCTCESRYEYIFRKREKNDRYRMNGATYGWSVAAMNAVKKLQRNVSKVDIPVLLFQADNDTIVNNKGQDRFAKKNDKVILIRMPNSKHEIYGSDYNTIKWYYEIIWKFLDKHIGGNFK